MSIGSLSQNLSSLVELGHMSKIAVGAVPASHGANLSQTFTGFILTHFSKRDQNLLPKISTLGLATIKYLERKHFTAAL